MKKKIIMALSGGMDSATVLGILLDQGYEVHCINFQYGSKHGLYEWQAAEHLTTYYGLELCTINLSTIFTNFKSNLLQSGGPIPEGHYEAESMRKTVVPMRNSIFACVLAGYAESIKASKIALGVHQGDHHIYPDCRTEYIKALDTMVYLATGGKVEVIAPIIKMDKVGILETGHSLKQDVPYHLTRTCYKNQPLSCGKCGACNERLEAFGIVGLADPIQYEGNNA